MASATIYEKYDINKDGTLSPDELKVFYADLSAARPDLGLTEAGFGAWFAAIDADSDGTIAPSELDGYLASINYQA